MKWLFIFGGFVVLVLSCAPIPARLDPFAVSETSDRFHPAIRRIESNRLRVWGTSNIWENVSIWQSYSCDSSEDFLAWSVLYVGFEWAFVKNVDILIDKKVMRFEPADYPKTNVGQTGIVTEQITFEIPDSFYQNITPTTKIAMRFNAEKRRLESDLSPEAVEQFRLFWGSVQDKRRAWNVPAFR